MPRAVGCGGGSPDEPEKPDIENPTPSKPDLPKEDPPVPGLSFTSITLPNEGDKFACVIHGLKDDSWSVESNNSWCLVSKRGNILEISVTPNNDSDKRSAKANILHSDNSVIGSITIIQCSLSNNNPIENKSSSKHTFYPLFTATWCPFSPDMDKTLEEVQKRWEFPILPMRIHVTGSELHTALSDERSELYDNSSTPVGYFENYFKVSNIHDQNVSIDYFWNLILSNTQSGNGYTSRCSAIGCKSTMSDDNINAEISITPIKAGKYRLLVFILEDNIIRPQMSETEGEISDYCHNCVLVGAMTPVRGEELELTSYQKNISMKCPVPSNVNRSNLRLLIVLERNETHLNYSDKCWYEDNCISVALGKEAGNGMTENIYIGEDIEN